MKKTENLGLNKPEITDFYNVGDFNENMDIIDEEIKKVNIAMAGLTIVPITKKAWTALGTGRPANNFYIFTGE